MPYYSITVLFLLLLPSAIYTAEYRFLQMYGRLFATDGIKIWHVNMNNFKNILPNASSSIEVSLQTPFSVWPNQEGTFANGSKLKCAFAAHFSHECGGELLVLLDQELNYRAWKVQVNQAFFAKNWTTAVKSGPLIVEELTESSICDVSIPTSGNLKNLTLLRELFTHGQTLTSVFGRHHNTILYFVGMSNYIKLNLTKWTQDKTHRLESSAKLMPFKSNVCPNGETIMSFRSQYLLRVGPAKIDICPLELLYGIQISSPCTMLNVQTLNSESRASKSSLDSKLRADDVIINDINEDYETGTPSSVRPILILLIVIVIAAIVLIIIYIVIVKYFCQYDMITMPISGINSQLFGKMRSTSSIKTINSVDGKMLARKKT